jgi:hypothetical protein
MKAWFAVAVMAVAGPVLAQEAAPAAQKPPVVVQPILKWAPTGAETRRYYPEGVAGKIVVNVHCELSAAGKTHDCVVLDSTPPSKAVGDAAWKFGQGAVKMATDYRLSPKTVDGVPVDGSFETSIEFADIWNTFQPMAQREPTPEEFQAVWPEKARGVAGSAVLKCKLDREGKPILCLIEKESPRGLGFGAAAMKLAGSYRLSNPTPYGSDTSNVVVYVHVPVEFKLPEAKGADAAPPAAAGR